MRMLIAISCIVAACVAEPPVNSYLPPNRGSGGAFRPSSTYGAPGLGGQRQTSAVFGGRPSSTYGAPGASRRPSTQYGAPSQFGAGQQSGRPSQQYTAPGNGQGFGFGGQSQAPSSQYGLPNGPSQQYGAPGFEGPGFGGSSGAQSRQYLPPGGRGNGGYDDGSNGEPANYNFEYMVKDEESGNDFGHRESRQGDRAEGLYYVLLPDGRKQTVQYEADQDGYKPKISYEDIGLGGYQGRQGSQQGGQGSYQGGQGSYQGGQGSYQGGQGSYQGGFDQGGSGPY